MRFRISPLPTSPPAHVVEVVERKGVGHPDTLCDLLAEAVSVGLSRAYVERFGQVLHHNVDKALLIGGAARPAFGGGQMLKPIEITLAGRATRQFAGAVIPVEELAVEIARNCLKTHVRNLDSRCLTIVPRIRETSPDLASLFVRTTTNGVPLANDSSIGVGFAPLDALERTVLAIERCLASEDVKQRHPEIGDDVKVLAVRNGASVEVTVACAFIGRHVADLSDYREKKERTRALVKAAAMQAYGGTVDVQVTAADGDNADSIYLTVTGLSAEAGDDGEVGRGNRVNGLITPYRPMTLEAAAGKNPVTHTGKLYNLLANRIARALTSEIPGIEEAYCYLVSRIGAPVDDPQVADIHVRVSDPASIGMLEPQIEELLQTHLRSAPMLWRDVLTGRVPVC